MTKSRISSPSVTSVRPMAAIVRRTTLMVPAVDSPPARWSPGSPVSPARSYTLAVSLPGPRSSPLALSCTFGRPFACSDDFPRSRAPTSRSKPGEIVLLGGRERRGQDHAAAALCAGLLPLRSGQAEVLGVDLAVDRRAIRRALALVGHETFCYDDLTVHENIRFASPCRPATRPPTPTPRSSGSRLRRVAHVTHGRLSQGQRRRVSLAIALARKPRLLLLDEPHAGLDEQGRAVLDEIVRAAPAEGRTVLLASHELDLARQLATREVRIAAGQVHARAEPTAPRRPTPRRSVRAPRIEARA